MNCQASGWDVLDPWCDKPAESIVPLTLVSGELVVRVWLCDEHFAAFEREMEKA